MERESCRWRRLVGFTASQRLGKDRETQHGFHRDSSPPESSSVIAISLNPRNSGISFYEFMEKEIKTSLDQLLAAIKTGNAPVIAAEMGNLDDFLARGRETLHPQLVHFLQNRSYAKAALFLGGAVDVPVGACGGRARR
jgi:hypothetical protein